VGVAGSRVEAARPRLPGDQGRTTMGYPLDVGGVDAGAGGELAQNVCG